MSKNITADLTDLQELLELFELMEQGAPWSSEILPLDGRMALLRRWLAEVRPREPAKCWRWPWKVEVHQKKVGVR